MKRRARLDSQGERHAESEHTESKFHGLQIFSANEVAKNQRCVATAGQPPLLVSAERHPSANITSESKKMLINSGKTSKKYEKPRVGG